MIIITIIYGIIWYNIYICIVLYHLIPHSYNVRPPFVTFTFNIAMGNGPFVEVYLLKIVIFHSYVSLPEGKPMIHHHIAII